MRLALEALRRPRLKDFSSRGSLQWVKPKLSRESWEINILSGMQHMDW